jgi:GNAT superfamily N-acetyltransferase
MEIRTAKVEDAAEACNILRRSIAELCRKDHHDDPIILGKWLSNKTPDNVLSWITHPDNCVAVATEGARIIGVGAMMRSGEITLNYVSPDARFRGVSKATLKWLEARALELGNVRCALKSTETARRFYLSNGYVQQGTSTGSSGAKSYAMVKQLAPTA